MFFFFNDTATTEIYTYLHTLSLHDALPISAAGGRLDRVGRIARDRRLHRLAPRVHRRHRRQQRLGIGMLRRPVDVLRSEEPTSELQSLMRISYAVFCLKKKNNKRFIA